MTSKDIRETFLNFFKDKNHRIVPSAPMVIKDDPTLMFTNAGMNQFKEYFLGHSKPKSPRVTDTQKCLRVSGKHNDLEEVGKDTYHHTMFEMLGNWSFGDYFKKEAISWAWELLTEVYSLDKDRLYVSVFEGSTDGEILDRDQQALDLWKEIIPESRIIMGSKKDNFWEMGEQGPCGPSSEIHIDLRPDKERSLVPGAELVNQDHPLVVEIWNLVFIEYNRLANGTLEPLPQKHIDTGMGFERLCMALQGVTSNYDTDIFQPLIREISKITNTPYGKDKEQDIAIRVIADHIRAVSFSIADGQLPSNTGAGYVIRRILRRAVRYGFTFLQTKEPFIYKLLPTLVNVMGEAYPELKEQQQLIGNVIREEEQAFLRTLEQGLNLLDTVIAQASDKKIDGRKAFELYDTYGFPIDLTALILEEKGFSLDEKGFSEAMKEQKDRSRKASEVSHSDWVYVHKDMEPQFLGYDSCAAQSKLVKYRKVMSAKEGDHYQLVLSPTPFYAEGGGQVGDKGHLETAKGERLEIFDTRRENNETIHFSKELPQDLKAELNAHVDLEKRRLTERNHTATHLLHQALRAVLGKHVEQRGSSVTPHYLRFDFSHFSRLSPEELKEVEDFVNTRIASAIPLEENRDQAYDQALEAGAIALFGEKYGERVRTVRFGESVELCGGTHVKNTAEIWYFKIRSEGAIASGIRRIEAITSQAAREYFLEQESKLQTIQQTIKGSKDPLQAVQDLQQENQELRKEMEGLQKEQLTSLKLELEASFENLNGIRFLAREVSLDAALMKDLLFSLAEGKDNVFMCLASEKEGKAILSCYIAKGLVSDKGLNAGKVVKDLGKLIRGGGGGQPFFATAGGSYPQGIPGALEKARDLANSAG